MTIGRFFYLIELLPRPVAVAHARGAKEVSKDVATLRKAERDHYAKKYGGGGSASVSGLDDSGWRFNRL